MFELLKSLWVCKCRDGFRGLLTESRYANFFYSFLCLADYSNKVRARVTEVNCAFEFSFSCAFLFFFLQLLTCYKIWDLIKLELLSWQLLFLSLFFFECCYFNENPINFPDVSFDLLSIIFEKDLKLIFCANPEFCTSGYLHKTIFFRFGMQVRVSDWATTARTLLGP